MILTIDADPELSFPILDEILAEAVSPYWDVITKLYIGPRPYIPIDAAVKRYFGSLRPVVSLISREMQVDRSDYVLLLCRTAKALPLYTLAKRNGTPTILFKYKMGPYLEKYRCDDESPF
jgi:hypothetical protein